MELIERSELLTTLQQQLEAVAIGEGHCVLITGEAGMGKTSLIRAFCKQVDEDCVIYQGVCDALFTPRPLAPVYDILVQMGKELPSTTMNIAERSVLFASLYQELKKQRQTGVIVMEDVHWADEATLDFIKFLARRITQLHCLLILSFRDNEIHSSHPLLSVCGQLSSDSCSRMPLMPLSQQAVEKLAFERGWKGEDVYSISGGNPFYVTEILANYSLGVPENVKDSILSVYNSLGEQAKQICQFMAVLPTGLEIENMDRISQFHPNGLQYCLDMKILIADGGMVRFKHELYRRTIEKSLSPLVRIDLNKKILDLFIEDFDRLQQLERIVHHAKNANEPELVARYGPIAGKRAASLGAHIEATKLYWSAIEYDTGNDGEQLVDLYRCYAFECYLTNRIKEAIIYSTKALHLLKEKNDIAGSGDCLRLLSRLWWFDGNGKKAEECARQAIEVLSDQPLSKSKAMAYSNMSQLKMLSDQQEECVLWGEKAIALAKTLGDEETLAHALNNVGTVQMDRLDSRKKGIELLQESLKLALKNGYDDHAARAFTNLSTNSVEMKDYATAKLNLENAIHYCEERNLDSYTPYLSAYVAKFYLETGRWDEAYAIAEGIIKAEEQQPVVRIMVLVSFITIKMRRGDADVVPFLLEAKEKAFETQEAQRIIPVLTAVLEYEWITSNVVIEKSDLDLAVGLIETKGNIHEKNEFNFWLSKARGRKIALEEIFSGYQVEDMLAARRSASVWQKLGCPYHRAMMLFEGDDDDKRSAIAIVHQLGAVASYERMKLEMRTSGIKNIPRGLRKSTQSNPAQLTARELDVLKLLKAGLQNKEIANKLFISTRTVDHHLSSIFFKLEVSSRARAVQEAIELNII